LLSIISEDIDSVTDQYLSSGLRQQNLTKVAHNLTRSVRHSIKEQNIKGLLASSRDRIIDGQRKRD